MKKHYVIGYDIGGSGGRCLLYDFAAGTITVAGQKWEHKTAKGTGSWGYDLDTGMMWRTLAEITGQAMTEAGVSAEQIAGVAAASMRHGFVLVDREGRECFAVPNTDARAITESMEFAGEYGEALYKRTGHWPLPITPAARFLWLKKHHSEILDSAACFLSISDWLTYRFCGRRLFEASQAGESMLFDITHRNWMDDVLHALGLPRHLFPEIARAGEKAGNLTKSAAAHLGLIEGIPVAVGGADTQNGLLGAGIVSSGSIGVIAGTTAVVQLTVDNPVIDETMRLWTSPHLVPGLWVMESNAGTVGEALDWLAGVLYPGHPSKQAALLAEGASVRAGACGLFSTIGVQVFHAREMGLSIGNLTLSHLTCTKGGFGRPHIARAFIEGLAYAVRANVEQVLPFRKTVTGGGTAGGDEPVGLILGGGMTKSPAWPRILSNVTGSAVSVPRTAELSALGAAMCAAVGAGVYPDLSRAAGEMTRPGETVMPDKKDSVTYAGLYPVWNDLRIRAGEADAAASGVILEESAAAPAETVTEGADRFRPKIYASADLDGASIRILQRYGEVITASYRDELKMLAGDELVEALAGCHVLITEVDIVDASALRELPDLRCVFVCRSNAVNVDLEACTALGIPVINTPGRNADAVAELTMTFMLMLARRMPEAADFLRQEGGEAGDMGRMGSANFQLRGSELSGLSIGLVGAGAVGKKVIERLRPFHAKVYVFDPYLTGDEIIVMGAEKVPLEELLSSCDIISLHAPVTDETRGIIGREAFEKMKRGVCIINTARPALLDHDALIEALRNKKAAGAALDVFPVEPPGADDPLLSLPGLIATPHIGGNTAEIPAHQGRIVAEELGLLLDGRRPRYVLNPGTLAGFSWTERKPADPGVLDSRTGRTKPSVTDSEPAPEKTEPAGSGMGSPPEPERPRKGLFRKNRGGRPEGVKMETAPAGIADTYRAAASGGAAAVVKKLDRILEAFVGKICRDSDLARFSRGKAVVMSFTLKDTGHTFYMSFQDGNVDAGLGASPAESNVMLKMNAEILDGLFTGRLSGPRMAITGKLSFSGDTSKAMTFQRIQKDITRLYSAAREEAGDPGDLSALGKEKAGAGTPGAAAPRAPSSVLAEAPQIRMAGTGDVRDEILKVANELYSRGIITPTGGNVSARCDDNRDEIWITPSQVFKGNLRADMMVRIDLKGRMVGESEYSASSERKLHSAIYAARPEAGSVIHSHAPQATLLGLTGTPFLPISTEAAFIGDIPVVPFMMPGSDGLSEAVARAIGTGAAVILQNHGIVVAGSSVRRAADLTDIIEVTAEKIMRCRSLGVDPPVLPEDVVAALREMGDLMA